MKVNKVKGIFTSLNHGIESGDIFSEYIEIPMEIYDDNKNASIISLPEQKVYKKLADYLQQYARIIRSGEFTAILNKLIELETQINQARCYLDLEIKLGLIKRKNKKGEKVDYVIAKTPFYRENYKRSEITIYMGTLEEYNMTLEDLKKDKNFISKVSLELRKAMMKEF